MNNFVEYIESQKYSYHGGLKGVELLARHTVVITNMQITETCLSSNVSRLLTPFIHAGSHIWKKGRRNLCPEKERTFRYIRFNQKVMRNYLSNKFDMKFVISHHDHRNHTNQVGTCKLMYKKLQADDTNEKENPPFPVNQLLSFIVEIIRRISRSVII